MPQHRSSVDQPPAGPRIYVTPGWRFNPVATLLALLLGLGILYLVTHALALSRHNTGGSADDDDDPSRVDTIYLGGPDQAPTAKRPAARPSTVHPFVVVHLPRSGDGLGQIPDTPAGRLLFGWLAAFNGSDPAALVPALSTAAPAALQAAELELRRETGGFTLLSAKEIAPGVLVFRLHDQTPTFNESLGTLEVDPRTTPPSIASFSLRALPPPASKTPSTSAP